MFLITRERCIKKKNQKKPCLVFEWRKLCQVYLAPNAIQHEIIAEHLPTSLLSIMLNELCQSVIRMG